MRAAESYDVAVVGGGLIGAACADALAGEGLRVCLLEKGPFLREASWAGAGILHPIHPWEYPAPLQELLRAAPREYGSFVADVEARTGRDVHYERSGLLVMGDDLDRLAAWLADDHDHRFVTAADDDPAVRIDARALLLPDAHHVRSHRLGRALLESAAARGADLFDYRPVTAIHPGRVETATGDIDAAQTVVCAGAWAARLLPELDVEPVRGQILLYRGRVRRMSIFPDGSYVVPRRDDLFLFGSTLERVGFQGRPTEDACAALAIRAERLLGAPRAAQVCAWAGLRPGTASLRPCLGRHPSRADLVLACGHFRNGILLAPLTARLVTDVVVGRASPFDLRSFGPPEGKNAAPEGDFSP